MAMLTSTILALSALAVSAGGTAYQAKTASDASGDAKDAARQQQGDADRMKKAADTKASQDAINASVLEQQKQRKTLLGASGGLGSTILTSPLGTSGASAPAKTLLGM